MNMTSWNQRTEYSTITLLEGLRRALMSTLLPTQKYQTGVTTWELKKRILLKVPSNYPWRAQLEQGNL
jgi:hypothetical protein